jgi:malonyl-CoA O-methyltransferase
MPPPERSARRPLDAHALARVLGRLNHAAEPPWLHGEVARRMAERLAVIKLQPQAVADWPAFTGASRSHLRQAYPAAALLSIEPDAARREATAVSLARPWWSPERWRRGAARVLAPEQLAAGEVQLLWSNMALHLSADPQALFAAWQRAVAVDGFVMFSTLGPGTLTTLRSLYAALGWGEPFAPFVDMHDLGDMLVEAGFADPVMDQETLTLTWPDSGRALDELRGLGGNMAAGRTRGLRTPRWRQRLLDALSAQAKQAADGRIALEFELVYGHAFRPLPRPRVAAETTLPLDDLRAMVRGGRGAVSRGPRKPEDPTALG